MNSEKLLGDIQNWFETHGQTLAFAESCTGGLLSATLAARPGISKFFLGAVVSYHGKVKNQILGVPETLLQMMGEVSIPVALEMARGAKREIGSDWAVAITGIAGPTGGTEDKPVGTVCFAIVGPSFESSSMERFGSKTRREIQEISVEHAFRLLFEACSQTPQPTV